MARRKVHRSYVPDLARAERARRAVKMRYPMAGRAHVTDGLITLRRGGIDVVDVAG